MSYILDAIKKTESGKKDGDVPNLDSEHQHTTFVDEDDTRRWLLPLLLVIAVLFAVVIWLLLKPALTPVSGDLKIEPSALSSEQITVSQNTPKEIPTEVTESTAVTAKKSTVNQSKPEASIVSETAGLVIKKVPLEIQQPMAKRTENKNVETVSQRSVTEVVEPATTSVEKGHSGTRSADKPGNKASNKPVFLAAIDHEHWPTLIYTTHIYATKPEDRFVMLNGKAYSIGDVITKGMTVVDIMENDLLVDYQGQKVIVPSLSDVNP